MALDGEGPSENLLLVEPVRKTLDTPYWFLFTFVTATPCHWLLRPSPQRTADWCGYIPTSLKKRLGLGFS